MSAGRLRGKVPTTTSALRFRSINNPAIVFEVLAPRHQARFRFAKDREERIDGMAAWVVRFVEHATPTVVQTLKGNL